MLTKINIYKTNNNNISRHFLAIIALYFTKKYFNCNHSKYTQGKIYTPNDVFIIIKSTIEIRMSEKFQQE